MELFNLTWEQILTIDFAKSLTLGAMFAGVIAWLLSGCSFPTIPTIPPIFL